MSTTEGLPLAPYTVLELTRARAGPTAARQLADWGANVIKIEEILKPGEAERAFDQRETSDFQNLHRNKRSITLNLKDPDGLAIFKKLVVTADVVLENYRPDVKHRLGIDYESLKKLNPRLVYGSISGFGQKGPYRNRPGLDQVVQGMGGLMSITGAPGQGPVRAGIAVSDSSAGIYCAFGILLALLQRERTGQGQWVHTSLLQALIAMLDFQAARWLVQGEVAGQAGNDHPTGIPSSAYRSADGYVSIAASGHLFERLCKVIGTPELVTHPDYCKPKLRSKNRVALNALIGDKIAQRNTAEWVEALNEAGVPCGPIYTIDQVFADPQVRELGMAQPVDHPTQGRINLVGQGVTLGTEPVKLRTATPGRGEHTAAILRDLGYRDGDIDGLRQRGVV
jgi:crotonobetainyl-CoA:carnitine CoA-transferase CaiB-like acyl-CoA transferase